jgi:hypothetical protein
MVRALEFPSGYATAAVSGDLDGDGVGARLGPNTSAHRARKPRIQSELAIAAQSTKPWNEPALTVPLC